MSYSYSEYISIRKQMAPKNVHIPNKHEAEVLRKLMSKTGLNEKELREHKKYRIELSEAQKAQGSKNELERRAHKVVKSITKELKLAKEHPLVLAKLKEKMLPQNSPGSYYSTYKNEKLEDTKNKIFLIAMQLCLK